MRRPFEIAQGDPLLVHGWVHRPIEDLGTITTLDELVDPAGIGEVGSASAEIDMSNTRPGGNPAIDNVVGEFDHTVANFEDIPHIASSRYAHVGDVLELFVKNTTATSHPFHLHGFSFQVKEVYEFPGFPADPPERGDPGDLIRVYDHNEFVDVITVPSDHTVRVLVRLDDRPQKDGVTSGGAEGRWFFHCHIFFHAGLGMISELVVLPREEWPSGGWEGVASSGFGGFTW